MTVTATGTENVQPDVAEIRAGVTGSAALAEDALRKFRETRRRAVESIKKLGIANLAIEPGGLALQSANASANRMMQMFGNNQSATPPGQVTVTETLTLRLSKIDQMKPGEPAEVASKILDAAKDAGMNLGGSSSGMQSDLVRFRSTKLDHARTAASQHAMDLARRKALTLAGVPESKLKGLVSAREISALPAKPSTGASNPFVSVVMAEMGVSGSTETDDLSSTELKAIAISVTVEAQFAIDRGK